MNKTAKKTRAGSKDTIAKEYDDLRSKASYDEVVWKFLTNYESVNETIDSTIKEIKKLKKTSLKNLKTVGHLSALKEKEGDLLKLRVIEFEHVISFMVAVRRAKKLNRRGGYRKDTFIEEFKAYLRNVDKLKKHD